MRAGFAVSAATALVFGYPTLAGAQPTLENLLKECGQKIIVMGYDESGEPVQAGKRIDGYCSGFLEGALALLLRSEAICLKESEAPPTPEFLLSVIETYRANGGSAVKDVALLIETAFRRAFRCTR